MPTIRYQISNEFKLGNPLLYRASSKDEPEALLEGVAMAGLVGLLKQLGDLAEFASEIFHDLHKEMIATARRGHRLKLRVQQIEAEFPSIEKSFLCQSNQTHFLYDTGISWHTKLHMDKNLIIREGIPQFVADSYEECRGPPDLSALDKFDAAGDGACLKRYSDPSFFKLKLVKREKNAQDNTKTGPCWRNGENPGIGSTPHIESKLQFMRSKVASEELPVTHVKLKSRLLYESDTTSYVERLYQVLSPEERITSKSSKKSQIESKPITSCESISEVHETSSDSFSDIETNPSQCPITKETTEYEISTECTSDDYSSDGIASDVENYMDALNTMESEVETECKYIVKPNLDFTTTHGMNSGTKLEVELNSLENSHFRIKPVCEYGEEFSNCSITDSSFSLKHFSSNGVVKDSDVKLPCTSENSTVCPQTKYSAKSYDASSHTATVENIHLEVYAEELDLKDTNVIYDRKGETVLSSLNLLTGKSDESTKQLTEAFPDDIYLQKSSITMQTQGLHEEMEILGAPVDKLAYSRMELTLENTNFEPLYDVKEPEESYKQDQNDSEIIEKSVPMNMARIEEVCTPHMHPLSSLVDTQSITFAKLSNDFCHTIPNIVQEDHMDQYNIDKYCGSETSPCRHQDSEIEELVPIEESSELQGGSIPNLISFEKYLSLQNGGNQSKPIDNMGKSDSTCEPDSHVTYNNISFTDFLKLTQMDWLLNTEKEVNVDPLLNEEGCGLQFSHNAKDDSSTSPHFFTETQNTFEEVFEEIPPLPPLPPLEWRMCKIQTGHQNSHLQVVHSSVGKNLFTALSTIDKKSSHDLLAAGGATVQQSNIFVPLVEIEDEISPYNPLSNERDSTRSVKLSHTLPDIDIHPSIPFLSSEYESFEQIFPVSIPTTENERQQLDQLSNPDNHTTDMVDVGNPHLVHRPRDPLIEEVASHDKSMLRKVSEPVQPSAKLKTNECDTLVKEIRNKSHNLKPVGGFKPNMRAPAPILNAAILEKAISIRQACIGSDDDDDDGDSWSDS